MGRVGSGIEIRDSSIRLSFTHKGITIRERLTLDGKALEPTAANLKYAKRLAADIRNRIEMGLFNFDETFPDSPKAKPKEAPKTFGQVADLWIESKGQLQVATKDQYANAVALWKRILGVDKTIEQLTYQVLASKIGGHPWASAKSANNYLIVLRGIFEFHFTGPNTAANPMRGIKNMAIIKKLPDPLKADERDRILVDLQRYDKRVVGYFQFAFYTGMRPEEMIALQWSDIDFASNVVRVQRVRTFRGSERDGSKTHSERDVDLVGPALGALEMMKPYTFLKNQDVFENPVTGKPWHDERSQRDNYWAPTLKRLGIRHRPAYNTRHTYATVALMAGVKPPYIASQLGHTNTKMLFEKYARWINEADKGNERKALEEAFKTPNSSQNSSQKSVGNS